ncbi:MAG: hypothetical protein ACRC33_21885, partial [Gemmataceae bacterium]
MDEASRRRPARRGRPVRALRLAEALGRFNWSNDPSAQPAPLAELVPDGKRRRPAGSLRTGEFFGLVNWANAA